MLKRLQTAVLSRFGGVRATGASVDPLDCMIPTAQMADYVGGGGVQDFKVVGRMTVGRLREFGGLRPEHRVLEVGCGIGRIAIALTEYLKDGSYVGFDIVPQGIDWCRREVTSRFPKFEFFHSDIHNKLYNPGGRIEAGQYGFPFPDSEFDFIFLTSVFTHMVPGEVRHYTSEIGRVLRPGGRCFCTAFLIDGPARDAMARGDSLRAFAEHASGYWTDAPHLHEVAIGFIDDALFAMFREAVMEIRRVVPGEWWRDKYAQDVFVAEKVG
jgi:SAM-dependent methyltransferase